MAAPTPDSELKARHRAMWASGDYPAMVERFLLPLGPRLVEEWNLGTADDARFEQEYLTTVATRS